MTEGQWVEIPPHRVWVVDGTVVRHDYELLNANGELCGPGERYVRVRRKSDGKLFAPPGAFGGLVYTLASGTDHFVLVEV